MKSIQQFQTILGLKRKKEQVTKDYQGVQSTSEKLSEKTINDHQQSEDLCRCSVARDKGINQENEEETISDQEVENSRHLNWQQKRELMSCHLEIFKKVYSELGPNWTKMLRILNEDHQIFLGASTNELKNLFCNSMRRLGKIFERQLWKFGRRSVKDAKKYLLSMLEIVNQTDRVMSQKGQKPNPQSVMQKFKSCALTLCFHGPDQQKINQLIQVTRYFGNKMKCYGIFKVKNKTKWKVTEQSLEKLAYFSGMALSNQKDHFDLRVDDLMLYDESLNRSWMQKKTISPRGAVEDVGRGKWYQVVRQVVR